MPPPPGPPEYPPNALPRGTRLGECEVLDVLGVGGFGIVYLALDHALEREVAIKEYMPSSLVGRTATLHVSLRSKSDAETFALGLRSFVNEARLLARFDHPSLLKVHRFWEANDTAYMSMPVYRGRTLRAVRRDMAGTPDEAWLRALLVPLLGAIETLHAEGVYHRDIAPDNILIEPDGRPVLLDFGAARRVIGDRSQTLTAILKPSYAPIEQYADVSISRQGPWTDLYALGATLRFVLTGAPPPPATARALHDEMPPLEELGLPGCGAVLCRSVDWMLATHPAERPQSVAELRAVLDGQALPPQPSAAPVFPMRTTAVDARATHPDAQANAGGPAQAGADAGTVLDLSRVHPTELDDLVPPEPPPAASTPPTWPPAGSRVARMALAGSLVLGVAAVWWWLARPAADTAHAAGAAAAASAPAGGEPSASDAHTEQAAGVAALAGPGASGAEASPTPANEDRTRRSDGGKAPVARTPDVQAPVRLATQPSPPRQDDTRREPERPARPQPRPTGPWPTDTAAVSPPPVAAPVRPGIATPGAALAASGAGQNEGQGGPGVAGELKPAQPVLSDDPASLCGSRVLLALFWCMERECARDEHQGHPACRKWFKKGREPGSP